MVKRKNRKVHRPSIDANRLREEALKKKAKFEGKETIRIAQGGTLYIDKESTESWERLMKLTERTGRLAYIDNSPMGNLKVLSIDTSGPMVAAQCITDDDKKAQKCFMFDKSYITTMGEVLHVNNFSSFDKYKKNLLPSFILKEDVFQVTLNHPDAGFVWEFDAGIRCQVA
jgi:hypothetical protein